MKGFGVLVLMAGSFAAGQNSPAAKQALQVSAFGGVTGAYTGVHPNVLVTDSFGVVVGTTPAPDQGKNLAITAGVDVTLRPFFGVSPGIELRGSFPVDSGGVAGERTLLGGLRLETRFRVARVYGDLLVGRGEIVYNPPFLDVSAQFLYLQNISNVISPGAGAELDLSRHFAVRGDVQYQRYAAPVPAGHVWATPLTAALVYRFDFNRARGLPNR